jgi:hypothetical protein
MKLAQPLLVLALAACRPASLEVTGIVEQALEVARQEALEPLGGHAVLGAYRELVHDGDLAQGAELARGEERLTLVTLERVPGTERFERTSAVLEAGFAIAAVAAREAFDLVVAGVETDGAVVVERWRVDPRGARSGAEPTRVRTTLLRTRQIGDVRALVVDPDGRWVLVLAGDGERLLQVPLQTQGRLLALFEAEVARRAARSSASTSAGAA